MSILNLYSATWCPDCRLAKAVLDERGVEYNEIDIDGNDTAVEIIIKGRGKRVIPTLEYKGSFIDGNHFNREKFEKDLDALLGV